MSKWDAHWNVFLLMPQAKIYKLADWSTKPFNLYMARASFLYNPRYWIPLGVEYAGTAGWTCLAPVENVSDRSFHSKVLYTILI